jgi:GTPase SAR1 family protein
MMYPLMMAWGLNGKNQPDTLLICLPILFLAVSWVYRNYSNYWNLLKRWNYPFETSITATIRFSNLMVGGCWFPGPTDVNNYYHIRDLKKTIGILYPDLITTKEAVVLKKNSDYLPGRDISFSLKNPAVKIELSQTDIRGKEDSNICSSTYTLTLRSKVNGVVNTYLKFLESEMVRLKKIEYEEEKKCSFQISSRISDHAGTFDLTPRKTWDHIFFPQKETLIQLVNNFIERTGPYDPKWGRAHKLVLLLEGPPGTGKTSIIKALCTHFSKAGQRRNIKTFPNMFEEHDYHSLMRDVHTNPDQNILVLEDITDGDCDVLLKPTAKKDSSIQPENVTTILLEKQKPKDLEQKKEITLSQMLNIMDGLLEFDNAVIVMTTNHVEKLDPRFIRPGRVTFRLRMEYLQISEALEMLQFYQPELEWTVRDLPKNWPTGLTPCMVEQAIMSFPEDKFKIVRAMCAVSEHLSDSIEVN